MTDVLLLPVFLAKDGSVDCPRSLAKVLRCKCDAAAHWDLYGCNGKGMLPCDPGPGTSPFVTFDHRASSNLVMVYKRILATSLPLLAAVGLLGCGGARESATEQHREANTPAGKVGKAAHVIAKDAGKVAKVAGRELGKAAHQAREGWKEAARQDSAKNQ